MTEKLGKGILALHPALLKCGLWIQVIKAKYSLKELCFWFGFGFILGLCGFFHLRKIRVVLLLHPVPPMAWNQLKKVGSPRIPMIPILVTFIFMTTAVTAGTGRCILKLVLLQNMGFSPGLLSVQSKR